MKFVFDESKELLLGNSSDSNELLKTRLPRLKNNNNNNKKISDTFKIMWRKFHQRYG